MKRFLLLVVFFAAVAAPASAGVGMQNMVYYIGNWTCTAANVGQPSINATIEYTLKSGVLHELVSVPKQGKMRTPYGLSISQAWDAKNKRYVETSTDSEGAWSVSYAKPWSGNTEEWVDHESSTKPGRSTTVRDNANAFHFMSYSTLNAPAPDFKGSCKKSG